MKIQIKGQRIPQPGIVVLGRLDSGVDVFDVSGSTSVTIAFISGAQRRR